MGVRLIAHRLPNMPNRPRLSNVLNTCVGRPPVMVSSVPAKVFPAVALLVARGAARLGVFKVTLIRTKLSRRRPKKLVLSLLAIVAK